MTVPILSSERLLFRPIQRVDAVDFYRFASDPEIAAMGMWEPFPSIGACRADIEEMLAIGEREGDWTWSIVHRKDNLMIGLCQILRHYAKHARAELGYMYNRHYWGHGYATEAAHTIVNFAFTQMKLHRLEATVLSTNVASIAILKKIGMQYEGCKREARQETEGFVDLHIYGLLTSEILGSSSPSAS